MRGHIFTGTRTTGAARRREIGTVKVWQAGLHLTMQRGAEVNDWSRAQTTRRITTSRG